jgi:acetylornithine/N-succinyldiaminopimelate aminotransferase
VFDEVQCGMGRTGRLFAHEWEGVTPDIMAVAKGLGGGFPVGACLATERAAAPMIAGTHGSTFGGNPLAMAIGNAVLDVVLADGFLGNVGRIAAVLRGRLAALVAKYPAVFAEVRGAGLLLGLRGIVPNTEIIDRARAKGLLSVAAGDEAVGILDGVALSFAAAGGFAG